MSSFSSLLEERARQVNSLLCVGLDPHPVDLPEHTPAAAKAFCLRLIEATADLALAFKPNAAFFEALGAPGWEVLAEVIAAVPEGIPVILDAKRGDIAATSELYARSAYTALKADAVTVNPYLGYDSIKPFLADPSHGAFLLCRTSNPGSVDLQELPLGGDSALLALYEKVASLAQEWNINGNLGLVVGATYPEALRRVRRQAPDLWILTPGVGAQGADLLAVLRAGLRPDGLGLLVAVSREIARAADPRQAALSMVEAIRRGQSSCWGESTPEQPSQALSAVLAEGLLNANCVRFGQFTLKSGLVSPIYIDLRQLVSYPGLLAEVAEAYLPVLRSLKFDRLAALPYAGLPISTAISLKTGWPMIYPRKEVKGYGTRAEIEGYFSSGERVVVIDDLATTGGSKFEAIEKLVAVGLEVEDVVVLIDRQSGAAEMLAADGFTLHAVLTLTQLLDYWECSGRIEPEKIAAVRAFLALEKPA
jgi:uridine monophosphate synthetase